MGPAGGLIFEIWIRTMAAISGIAAAWLLWHFAMLPRKKLLAKQVTQLALANTLAFGVQAALPWSWQNCFVRECLFKYFLGLSVWTESCIVVGTLSLSLRWTCINRCGEGYLVAGWFVNIAVIPIYWCWPITYHLGTGLCLQSRPQLVVEIVVPCFVLCMCIAVYVIVIVQACHRSPRSVADAHIRCSRGILLCFIICYAVQWCSLIDHLDPSKTSAADFWSFMGMSFLCTEGLVTMLQCMRHRYSSCGMNVAYQMEPEVLLLHESKSKLCDGGDAKDAMVSTDVDSTEPPLETV